MLKSVTFAIAAISTIAGPCRAESTCSDVYAQSISNVSVSTRHNAEFDYIWNQYCEINGEVRSESTQTNLSGTYAKIEGSFSGTKQEALQKMQNFCKQHVQERQVASSSYNYDRNVVVAAQRSFNDCLALEKAGVHVSQSVQDSRSVVLRVDFDPSKTRVDFRRMVYDPEAALCTTTGISSDGTSLPVTSETKEIEVTKPFSVVCERKAVKTADGTTKFDRFVAALDTNHGTYTVDLPTEEMLGYDLAHENRKRADALTGKIQELDSQLSASSNENASLRRKIDGMGAEFHYFDLGDGSTVPCGGNPDSYANGICGSRKHQLSHFSSRGGGRCGTESYAFVCLNLGQ